MYDDADRVAQGTLAHSIKKSFDGMAPSFNEEQATYASVVNTKNMLDYSRVNFNKALRTSVKKAFHISSKYPFTKQCAYVFRRCRRISTLRSTNLEEADSCN